MAPEKKCTNGAGDLLSIFFYKIAISFMLQNVCTMNIYKQSQKVVKQKSKTKSDME